MPKIIFTEEFCRPEDLHPFTLTRQIQDIRIGILTIREKWEQMLGLPSYDKKEDDYKDLARSVWLHEAVKNDTCYLIHGNVLPDPAIVKVLKKLKDGEFISTGKSEAIIFRISTRQLKEKHKIKVKRALLYEQEVRSIHYPFHIFQLNDWALRQDFKMLAKRRSQPVSRTNKIKAPQNLFLEKGARMEHCIVNAETGPVYIGKNAEVMEGCIIRGPFALGENACLKSGAKIYGATTIGPGCLAAGEIKNSILFGYSNKAHDGYLGDSVIGEWCNLGAGTTNSNLKNTATDVVIYTAGGEISAGLKCGCMMGDYSRTAINTSINTGTVIGVCCNVFGPGLTPKYIPSFSWGSDGLMRYEFAKAMADIDHWKKFKQQKMTEDERSILKYVFENF